MAIRTLPSRIIDSSQYLESQGLKFPGTQVASTDANTLDDYEEGTWTPAVEGETSAGTGTFTTQVGKYTKIGNLVHVEFNILHTSHTGTGGVKITGFPFTPASPAMMRGSLATYNVNFGGDGLNTMLYVYSGIAEIFLSRNYNTWISPTMVNTTCYYWGFATYTT